MIYLMLQRTQIRLRAVTEAVYYDNSFNLCFGLFSLFGFLKNYYLIPLTVSKTAEAFSDTHSD